MNRIPLCGSRRHSRVDYPAVHMPTTGKMCYFNNEAVALIADAFGGIPVAISTDWYQVGKKIRFYFYAIKYPGTLTLHHSPDTKRALEWTDVSLHAAIGTLLPLNAEGINRPMFIGRLEFDNWPDGKRFFTIVDYDLPDGE